jgi:hypothetical protein
VGLTPELGSDKFTRWAKAVWPYLVGIVGCVIVVFDGVIKPPADPITTGFAVGLISGAGAVGLDRVRAQAVKRDRDAEE